MTRLDGYLAAVRRFSPENAPERFAMRNHELAHWMYGNSAYAIKSVLHHWPIWSVAEAGAPPEAVRKGFVFLPTPIFCSTPVPAVCSPSGISKWCSKDSRNDSPLIGRPARHGVIDYIESVATESLRNALKAARNYTVKFRTCDWWPRTQD